MDSMVASYFAAVCCRYQQKWLYYAGEILFRPSNKMNVSPIGSTLTAADGVTLNQLTITGTHFTDQPEACIRHYCLLHKSTNMN